VTAQRGLTSQMQSTRAKSTPHHREKPDNELHLQAWSGAQPPSRASASSRCHMPDPVQKVGTIVAPFRGYVATVPSASTKSHAAAACIWSRRNAVDGMLGLGRDCGVGDWATMQIIWGEKWHQQVDSEPSSCADEAGRAKSRPAAADGCSKTCAAATSL
jgi:hypothetical protein